MSVIFIIKYVYLGNILQMLPTTQSKITESEKGKLYKHNCKHAFMGFLNSLVLLCKFVNYFLISSFLFVCNTFPNVTNNNQHMLLILCVPTSSRSQQIDQVLVCVPNYLSNNCTRFHHDRQMPYFLTSSHHLFAIHQSNPKQILHTCFP